MTSKKLFDLQKETALFLLDKIEKLEITPERAAKIARHVSSLLKPNLTDEEVISLIPQLDKDLPELSVITQHHLTKQGLDNVREILDSFTKNQQ